MKLTRQQRRKQYREFNKQIQKEGRSLLGRKLVDPDRKNEFQNYTASSSTTAVMPFCILFNGEHDLNDYMHACREGAEAFINNDQPKIIAFIREPGTQLPASKQEMMKIGTRIFKETAPDRTYIFIEVEGTKEEYDIQKEIGCFLKQLGEIPEDAPPPNWLSEYIYREGDPTNDKHDRSTN